MEFQPIIEYIEQVLRKEKGVPCCDIKIMKEHNVLFRYLSGESDYEGQSKLTKENLYFLYSCTKPITCAAAMQLVEKNIISLDDPVAKYLPNFKNVFLLEGEKRVAPKNIMTIRHLFTMSAGFDYNFLSQPVLSLVNSNPEAGTLDVVNQFISLPLNFEPGERFSYSLCHDVLAAVVEVASGMRFSEYLNKNIFIPLGMENTKFKISDREKDRLVAQYACNEPNKITPMEPKNSFQVTPNYESGGAGLISTVDDYSLFADAMANGGVGIGGARILNADTIDLMRTEQLKNFVVNSGFSCAAGPGYGYGLGVRTLIDKSGGQRSSLGEFGWDGAAGSYVMIDPKEKLSIFFAMHVRGWPKLIGCGHAPLRDLTYDILTK